MKVIFCDIDGVLNSQYHTKKNGEFEEIEKKKVLNLKKIIDATGAKALIVSHGNTLFKGTGYAQNRIELIKQYGGDQIKELILTHFLDSKEDAIKNWLSNHKDVSKYIIFDNEYDNYNELVDHLILIDGIYGLTYNHVKKAIKILNK